MSTPPPVSPTPSQEAAFSEGDDTSGQSKPSSASSRWRTLRKAILPDDDEDALWAYLKDDPKSSGCVAALVSPNLLRHLPAAKNGSSSASVPLASLTDEYACHLDQHTSHSATPLRPTSVRMVHERRHSDLRRALQEGGCAGWTETIASPTRLRAGSRPSPSPDAPSPRRLSASAAIGASASGSPKLARWPGASPQDIKSELHSTTPPAVRAARLLVGAGEPAPRASTPSSPLATAAGVAEAVPGSARRGGRADVEVTALAPAHGFVRSRRASDGVALSLPSVSGAPSSAAGHLSGRRSSSYSQETVSSSLRTPVGAIGDGGAYPAEPDVAVAESDRCARPVRIRPRYRTA